MVMRQNWHSVRDYATEFEKCVGRLMSYDKATLLQMFLWSLNKDLAEKVALVHPKSLLSAISIAEDLELVVCFAHRPVSKGGVSASSLGVGTLGANNRRSGMEDAGELDAGEEVVAIKANGGVDPAQAGEDGCLVQVILHKLVLGVLHVFPVVIRDILYEIVLGSPMRHSSRAVAQARREEVAQIVDRALLGSMC